MLFRLVKGFTCKRNRQNPSTWSPFQVLYLWYGNRTDYLRDREIGEHARARYEVQSGLAGFPFLMALSGLSRLIVRYQLATENSWQKISSGVNPNPALAPFLRRRIRAKARMTGENSQQKSERLKMTTGFAQRRGSFAHLKPSWCPPSREDSPSRDYRAGLMFWLI